MMKMPTILLIFLLSRDYFYQNITFHVVQNALTWKLVDRGRTLDRDTLLINMREAFKLWSNVTNLDLTEMGESDGREADISVRFQSDWPVGPYFFHGYDIKLAYSFYPANQKGRRFGWIVSFLNYRWRQLNVCEI